ncbi:type I polyketide synthase [Haliangium ochraceum]|uniref:Acyl transferase n=1 Tax=Haliangium ochraceum (strain DSM 14365 / JCM 11303 / SMP-2) TaxID=502025 RepID=D0LQX3_HALO1|nr:type I polyketide synthase [Haliangium ochraceum]ACY15481.1 Acyl transferase [Haliangium ochraceum DSM 14365]
MTDSASDSQRRALLERATVTIKKLRAENARLRAARSEPIAIVGMACRFPGGANDPDGYWRLLAEGVDAVREIPPTRWPAEALDLDALPALRWAGLLDDELAGFDAEFFGISPREAAQLDPQQRLLLEVSWEALENALQPAERLTQQPVGVFVGIASADYQHRILALAPEQQNGYSATGNMPSVAAGRVAHTLGLQGPCAAVDTACSSSLVALHMACQSLRARECDLALSGGVNLLLSPTWMRLVGLTQSLSPDGRCRTFDARANGFVRGEGCGVVALKRLSDAQRDGDRVWALLRGSAINHDGRSSGLTVPNVRAQEATLTRALASAEVAAEDIDYVEAHGTGTPLGDPIEIEALKAALGGERGDGSRCVLGSVKTNIGHLEAAAGIAGLIKVVLAMGRETVPAHLHLRQINPRISLAHSALHIAAEASPWPAGERPRRAVVSSFGISGTNAGVVVEEAPPAPRPATPARAPAALLLPLSARAPEALRALALAHAQRLEADADAGPGALARHVALTGTRRSPLPLRQGFVGGDRGELIAGLRAFAGQDELRLREVGDPPRVAMIFSGQGSQWLGMGVELYAREPVFRAAVDAFDAATREVAGWSVRDELFAEPARARLDRVEVIQPCIVAVQLALAALWRSWGVEPSVVVGQSMGEVSAACVAGALDLADAARVILTRSRLVKQLRGGAMASVELPAAELADALGEGLGVAAINGPRSSVVAGDSDAVDRFVAEMNQRGVFCRRVKVDYASHSPEVEPLRQALLDELAPVRGRAPALAFRSTVHGGWVGDGELDAAYWYQNLRQPVQLFPVLERLLGEDGVDVLLEVSPHPVLGPVLQAAAEHAGCDAAVLASLRREQAERQTLLLTLAGLYGRGQAVDFARVNAAADDADDADDADANPDAADPVARWTPLPTYPWQRRRHWVNDEGGPRPQAAAALPGEALPPGRRLRSPALRDAVYELVLGADSLRCFDSHRVPGGVIAPASWMLSMVLAALRDLGHPDEIALHQLSFARPLAIPEGQRRRVQLVLSPDGQRPARYQMLAVDADADADALEASAWTLLSEGAIALSEDAAPAPLDVAATSARLEPVAEDAVAGLVGEPGPTRWVEAVLRGPREVLCRLRGPRGGDHGDRYPVHPEPLNEALSAAVACAGLGGGGFAPVAAQGLRFTGGEAGPPAWIHGSVEQVESGGRAALSATLALYDQAGRPVAKLARLRCVPAALESSLQAETGLLARSRYALAWEPLAPPSAPLAPGRWLLVADVGGVCELLAARLEAEGHVCVRLPAPAADDANPADSADDDALTAAFADALADAVDSADGDALPLRGLIFGPGLDADADAAAAADDDDDAAGDALARFAATRALHTLARALAGRALAPVWIATRGAVAARPDETSTAPAAAALWGLGRVLGSEHPELSPRLLDLDAAGSARTCADQLRRALTLALGGEDQLALRGQQVLGLRLRRVRARDQGGSLALSTEGAYLITGGLGRLGLSVAEWLVARGARHLVLLARSLPSAAAEARIAALEAQGAEVLALQADVADAAALGRALAAADSAMPALRGVIHAAGQARQALLVDEPWRDYAQVLGAKAAGAWNLHQLTRERALDFFVCFSSIAGTLGFGGMGSYAAANAYLDAFAEYRRGRGLPALSVAWGVWDSDLDAQYGERALRVGLAPFAGADALAALDTLAAGEAAHAIVANMDWARYLKARVGAAPPWLRELAAVGDRTPEGSGEGDAALLGRLRALPEQAAAEHIADHVAGAVAETLGYPRHHALPRGKGFFDIGFDSLLAMDLRRRLSRDFAHPFPVTVAFDHPTIERLAAYLAAHWQDHGAPAAPSADQPSTEPSTETSTETSTERSGASLSAPAAAEVAAAGAPEPIALVGIGCRFPGGVVGPESYWELLAAGRDATSEAPRGRWNDESLFDPDPGAPGKFHVRRAGFLDDIESFDPEFFGISPREAARMDPQQRLLLEVTWEALEHAGVAADALVDSSTGVFVSGAPNQYLERFGDDPIELDAYALTGNLPCTLSGRVSYVLGLRGPNLFLDTGCSGALVALHLACQSLRAGECDLALVAGVNVLLSADMMIGLSKTGALSPDGRCKTFDAAANGFGRGEGCGVLVAKRLRDARADGDRVIAVVRGSAVNHDGRSGGLTVPSGTAQRALMERALRQAQLPAAQVGFVEAHGTGTQLGDPIEIGALAAVYGRASGRTAPCFLGAVKSNLGHLEAAAGAAGVIKAALALERGEIPPNVHLAERNPDLPLADEPFELPARVHPWPSASQRLAAVSSFGLGGTNAHAILERLPTPPETDTGADAPARPVHLLALSARHPEALAEQARRLAEHLARHPGQRPEDVAFSLNCGRAHLPHRAAVRFTGGDDLRERLGALAADPEGDDAIRGLVTDTQPLRVGFLFTGQGSQYAGMSRALYASQPVFREAFDACAEFLERDAERPLAAVLADAETIDRTGNAQPAIFAVQYALTRLWRSWGVAPYAVFGHSVGEVAAACAAGALTLEDALLLIRERARWMETVPDGGVMVSVRAPAEVVAEAIAPRAHEVAIAALNGPENTVISGAGAAVRALAEELRGRGLEAKELRVSVAFHSPALDPILEPFERATAEVLTRPPRLPWIGGLTGAALRGDEVDYWRRQMREPVQFTAAIGALAELGCDVLLEVGPHPTLTGLAAESLPPELACLPSLRRGQDDDAVIADSLGRLYAAGAPVDWRSWDRPFARRRLPLPTYPFQRRRLWFDAPPRQHHTNPVTAYEREHETAWYSHCEWREQAQAPAAIGRGHWVLLADRGGVAAALAAELEARGHSCSLLRPGDLEARDREASADAAEPHWTATAMARALDAVCPHGRPLRGVVHLWSLDLPATAALADADLEHAASLTLGSALALVQALAGRASAGGGPRLWPVTRGAVCTGADGAALAVAQAPLWGLGAVIANEHPELWGGALDADPADQPAAALAAALAGELLAGPAAERVAWREGRRLVARLVPYLPERTAPLPVHAEGCYLVTGGHGALGLAVAGWLVQRGAKHLVLMSRSGPDEDAQATIDALGAEGAEVIDVCADIGDPAQVRALLRDIEARGVPLRGVVHAAGVLEDGLLVNQSWEAFERVLRPKLRGAWHLHRNTRGLDFFVHFSSASALLGPHGQGSYAAANAFLDALAHRERAHGVPALSVNWGPWAAGMAARLDAETSRRTLGAGWTPLAVADGWRVLDRVVGSDEVQVAVLPANWATLASEGALSPLIGELAGAAAQAPAAARRDAGRALATLRATAPGERRRVLEATVRRVVERTLSWSADAELGRKQRFVEVGLDSLMAIEVRNRLQRELDLTLAATTLFNYPTVGELSEHLSELLTTHRLLDDDAGPAQDETDEPSEIAHTSEISSTPAPPIPEASADGASDDELSEDELVALIAAKYDSRT